MYRLKAYEIPEAGRQAKGTAIVNLLHLSGGETITAVIPIRDFEEEKYMLFATKKGLVKGTHGKAAFRRKNRLQAIGLMEGDELIGVKLTEEQRPCNIGHKERLFNKVQRKRCKKHGKVFPGG